MRKYLNNLMCWLLAFFLLANMNGFQFHELTRASAMKNTNDGSTLVYSPAFARKQNAFGTRDKDDESTQFLQNFAQKNGALPFSLKPRHAGNGVELHPIANGDAITSDTNNNEEEKSATNQNARDRFRSIGMKARFARRIEKIVEDRMTVREIFNRYVQNSTLHGFRFIFMDTFYIRRFLWLALTLTMATLFIMELINSIDLFYEYPFTTTSTIQYEASLTFPAVSICSLNQFLIAKVKNSRLKPLYDRGNLPFVDKADPGFDLSGRDFNEVMHETSQRLENMFVDCEWKQRDTAKHGVPNTCVRQNFTSFQNLHGQTCFTFNPGTPGYPLLSLNDTGLDMAFKLELDVKAMQALQVADGVGLNVIVHPQQETPILHTGFVVTPGFQTFVEMKVRETENLPPPYATRCGWRKLSYHAHYRQSSCFLELLSDEIKNRCRCRAEFMPDKSLNYCSLRDTIQCVNPTIHNFDRKTNEKCPVDCETIQYLTSLSYARFLTNFTDTKHTSYVRQLKSRLQPDEFKKYVEENMVVMHFFYQEMKKELVQQEASYDFSKLVGDVGGQLGLMLGASVLTLVEFVDLFFFTLYHQILRLTKRKSADS